MGADGVGAAEAGSIDEAEAGEFEFAALPVGEDGVSGGPVGFDAEEAVEALGFVVVTAVVDVRDDFGEGLGEVGVEEVCGSRGPLAPSGRSLAQWVDGAKRCLTLGRPTDHTGVVLAPEECVSLLGIIICRWGLCRPCFSILNDVF